MRTVFFTNEFREFYNKLDKHTQDKYDDNIKILETSYIVSAKFVKRLTGVKENLYELRVSVGFNEYRSILFSANHDNIIQATEIYVLNGFLKKFTKDYDKHIKRAINIINTIKL
jgi:mRNA-degrading endonuclease RelE of RelBE toxin-antitoxin system